MIFPHYWWSLSIVVEFKYLPLYRGLARLQSLSVFPLGNDFLPLFFSSGVSQSGHFQFPDSDRSSQSREQRQLPLTLLDQVSDNSLLVSVELNGVVYQGVLFARPSNRPDSRKSNEDYWTSKSFPQMKAWRLTSYSTSYGLTDWRKHIIFLSFQKKKSRMLCHTIYPFI